MGLARALAALPQDARVRDALFDVIVLLHAHPGEWFDVFDVARRTGHDEHLVSIVVGALEDGFVLDCDGAGGFRYVRDVCTDLEMDDLIRRVRAEREHVRENLNRFRGRLGPSA